MKKTNSPANKAANTQYRSLHYINGKFTEGKSKRQSDIYNPSSGKVQGSVVLAEPADIRAAVDAAQKALPAWSNTPPIMRARVMFRFMKLLQDNIDELSKTLTLEHGKTFADSKGELQRGIENVEFATGICELLKGSYTEQNARGIDAWMMRQPLGVVAGITPFNFPAMVPMWMYPLAIACGNTFVLKPSERDPSVNTRIAQLLKESGLPDGVFNIVQGDKVAVDAILTEPRIKAVSFVGSTPIASYIYHTGCQNNKRVQALGGAKNHMVIMPDADLDLVVNALLGAAYGSCGERCMAISVAVAVGKVGDELIKKITPKVAQIRSGDGMDKASEMGPLVSAASRDRVVKLISSAEKDGAKILVDGRGVKIKGCEGGYFVGATLIDNVKPKMSVYQEEIFGPVLIVVRVPDIKSAMALIEDNPFGNGVAIYTRDGGAAREFVRHINIGMVGVNVPLPVPMAFNSFGGWKDSIFGSHGIYGPEGVHFYTRNKAVMQRWPDVATAPEFTFPTNQ